MEKKPVVGEGRGGTGSRGASKEGPGSGKAGKDVGKRGGSGQCKAGNRERTRDGEHQKESGRKGARGKRNLYFPPLPFSAKGGKRRFDEKGLFRRTS